MKLFTSKGIFQKVIIIIIIILLFNFIIPLKSSAGLAGLLFDPIHNLALTIFDIVPAVFQALLIDGTLGEEDSKNLTWFFADPKEFPGDRDPKDAFKKFEYKQTGDHPEVIFYEEDLNSNVWKKDKYAVPTIRYTPDKIFANQIPALDINFINPKNWAEDIMNHENYLEQVGKSDEDEKNKRSIVIQLHDTIRSWYITLRNLTLVALMIVLLYLGIRMVISSVAYDKAKYKKMAMDWFVALCLLVSMHYIMTFTITIIQNVTEVLAGGRDYGNNINVTVYEGDKDDGGTPKVACRFSTDIMGLIRFKTQLGGWIKIANCMFYMTLVIYTCFFTFRYLLRVLNIAFLTLFAPIMVLTYPIDKIKDSKSQAFDMWFKEYMFNALIQPLHLLLYIVFVGSAVNLVVSNPLYAIFALAFIGPAEKLLKKFFGFDRSTMVGSGTAFAGGAAAMALAKQFLPSKSGSDGKGGKKESAGNSRIKQANLPPDSTPSLREAFGDNGDDNGGGNGSGHLNQNQVGGDDNYVDQLDAFYKNMGQDLGLSERKKR